MARRFHLLAPAAIGLICAAAFAQVPTTSPSLHATEAPTVHPLLEQLNQETQQLYRQVRPGVVRVQLPVPRWVDAYALGTINRWEKLDPEMRRQIQQQWRQNHTSMAPASSDAAINPPNPSGPGDAASSGAANGRIIFVRPPVDPSPPREREAVLGGKLTTELKTAVPFAPNNVGLVLDDQGHILVPLYVEAEACAGAKLRISTHDGNMLEVKYLGSDRQTNLTLLQTDQPTAVAIYLASQRPENGSMVMYLSLNDASGRLGLWDGGARDYSIVCTLDGHVAGIVRYGQFLSGSACKLIADQIIRYGTVKRAALGVIVSEMRKDDPLREQLPVLGARTAMHVDEVIAGSPAERAGLKAGDLLLSLAGESVSDIPSFAAAIAARTGETELQLLRDGSVLTVKAQLEQK